ncbi:MAG: hypothetical protein FJW38_05770 [Acidobacteria bacterium]|nr:hypothetical protein [Acidobacteriota bacterium]
MKVLLDECIPSRFRRYFKTHEVHSVEWAGFEGLKNGRLLTAAEQAGYEVLLSVDQGLATQQNLDHRQIAILIAQAPTNKIDDLVAFMTKILDGLERIAPGTVLIID